MLIVAMQTMVSVFLLIRNPANEQPQRGVAGAFAREFARAPATEGPQRTCNGRPSPASQSYRCRGGSHLFTLSFQGLGHKWLAGWEPWQAAWCVWCILVHFGAFGAWAVVGDPALRLDPWPGSCRSLGAKRSDTETYIRAPRDNDADGHPRTLTDLHATTNHMDSSCSGDAACIPRDVHI